MTHSGIWLSEHSFMDFAETGHADLTHELAVRGGSQVGLWMGLLPDPDPVLRKNGEGLAALEALAADYKVTSCTQTRKLKTLRRKNYAFSPGALPGGTPAPEAVALCDNLARDLERIDLYNIMGEVLDAPFYGLTVAELSWSATGQNFQGGSRMRLTGITPKPREWFAFDAQNRLRLVGDGFSALGEWEEGAPGHLPPHGKFVVARHFPTYKNPYCLRLLSRCLFPVAFKRGGTEFMMRFAERWGMPWILGKGRKGAAPGELRNMRDSLAGMVTDAVAVVNSGADVQLLQAGGQAGDLHLSIVRHWDDAIAQVLAGQTLTSNVGENGSYAASKTHGDILDDYAEADGTLVKIFFDELAWTYGQITARGVLTPTFAFEEPEDQAARATLGKELHAQGVRFAPAYFERRFGLAKDEFTVADPEKQAVGAEQPGSAFTAKAENAPSSGLFTPGQQAIEDLVAELLPQGVRAVEDMTETILNLLAKADTPEDVERLLAEALAPKKDGGLDASAFQGVLEAALFAADMTGRFTARENVE